ncbi:MAG: hypothetical protein MUF31_03465 [Akkermansiaceae bacterium]|nr:hypothetical protein [Akkermansiaceae bacterium]
MSAPKAKPIHHLEMLGYRAFGAILGQLSVDSCLLLGEMLGRLFYHLSPRYRRLVRRNLRIATADRPRSESELDALVRETFRRAGGNFLASFKTETLPTPALADHFDPSALQTLREMLPPRGTVLAMAHMGNWEALPRLASLVLPAHSYGAIYRPLNNPLMEKSVCDRRRDGGARLFSRHASFHSPAAFLKSGGILAVLADHRAGASGFPLAFFGKMTTCSPLPSLLARRSKARSATMGTRSLSPGKWTLEIRHLPDSTDPATITAGLEAMMRDQLTEVFWFHDRWKIDNHNPLSLYTRLDPAIAATATVPLRLLLSTPADADESGVQAMLAAMFALRPDLRVDRLKTARALPSKDLPVHLHEWDPDAPAEQGSSLIRRIDAAHPAPLDGFLLLGSEQPLARAAREMDFRCIIGMQVSGKPWSRSLDLPSDPAGWAALADDLCWIPDRYRS